MTVLHGDCLDVMASMPDCSVDAIVTDPPYGLGFMGKAWDDLPPGLDWARECLRVLKPGGHLLAFGGTRTWHRLAVAVEDAGFEMRDSIAWLYGSGFPKSLDVSKAIDKIANEVIGSRTVSGAEGSAGGYADGIASQRGLGGVVREIDVTAPATPDAERWQGWGTALKPAFEPIVVARKPLAGTVAANVLAHGTGALNVDGCRIGTTGGRTVHTRSAGKDRDRWEGNKWTGEVTDNGGRWPANVVLGHTPDCDVIYEGRGEIRLEGPCAPGCPVAELDRQSGERPGFSTQRFLGGTAGKADGWGNIGAVSGEVREGFNDSGGASRFFYVAKAPSRERPRVDGVAHPTVKPLALMRWLVRLVTPPGGVVLDTFAGSGTTGEAAALEGFDCILIEREADYLPLIAQRLARVQAQLTTYGHPMHQPTMSAERPVPLAALVAQHPVVAPV